MPTQTLRYRFWLESILALLSGALGIVTIFWQDWIETLFGVDPDGGNGTAEWLIVLILLLLASVLAVRARLEWRRAQAVST
jgi:hypothetical protein